MNYIVATSPGHYAAAHRLLRDEGFPKQSLTYPTIMAWDGEDLIGICGTRIVDKMILAGPLAVKTDQRHLFTMLRLAEAYENAMSNMGIVTFILSVEHGSILQRGMERYCPDQKPYASKDGYDFYHWKVRGYGRRSERSGSFPRGEGPPEESGRAAGSSTTDH